MENISKIYLYDRLRKLPYKLELYIHHEHSKGKHIRIEQLYHLLYVLDKLQGSHETVIHCMQVIINCNSIAEETMINMDEFVHAMLMFPSRLADDLIDLLMSIPDGEFMTRDMYSYISRYLYKQR